MTNNLGSCNIDVVEELNGRILERNNGYGTNNVLLGQRSQPTKYVLPLDAIKPKCNTPILNYDTNNTFKSLLSFDPGTKINQWSHFAANINNESILKNQVYALQRSPEANYVPSSNSELYNSTITFNNYINNTNNTNNTNNNPEAMFPTLFNSNIVKQNSNNHLQESTNLGNLFNNHTRQQLKDS